VAATWIKRQNKDADKTDFFVGAPTEDAIAEVEGLIERNASSNAKGTLAKHLQHLPEVERLYMMRPRQRSLCPNSSQVRAAA
jgi:hypothetical protein